LPAGGHRCSAPRSIRTTRCSRHISRTGPWRPSERFALPQGVIHIERSRFLWGSRLYERLTLTNFSEHDAEVPLKLGFAADFADIFEVQGHVRKERGVHLPALVTERTVQLSYRGRDEVVRSTDIAFSLPPASISPHDAE